MMFRNVVWIFFNMQISLSSWFLTLRNDFVEFSQKQSSAAGLRLIIELDVARRITRLQGHAAVPPVARPAPRREWKTFLCCHVTETHAPVPDTIFLQ